MKLFFNTTLVLGFFLSTHIFAQPLRDRDVVVLENGEAKMIVDIAGGSIASLTLPGNPVNPLHILYPDEGSTAPAGFGHFLCLDRRGAPSIAEQEQGMPFHGEATNRVWDVTRDPHQIGEGTMLQMSCTLPIARMEVDRKIIMYDGQGIFKTTETVTNTGPLGRVYNIMQHVSLGGDFLDTTTTINTNMHRGFVYPDYKPIDQEINDPETWIYWPKAVIDGHVIDFRHMRYEGIDQIGVPFAPADSADYGWLTAYHPEHKVLIGYVWKTHEYPWMFMWRDFFENKQPRAYCTEFGTVAPGWTFEKLVKKHSILDIPLFEWIDATQSITKSYLGFITPINGNFKGVQRVEVSNEHIQLIDKDGDVFAEYEVTF